MKRVYDRDSAEPKEEEMRKVYRTLDQREEKKQKAARASSFFQKNVWEKIGTCKCGSCDDIPSERPLYCCKALSLYSSSLTSLGAIMANHLSSFVLTSHSCVADNPKFRELYLNENVKKQIY